MSTQASWIFEKGAAVPATGGGGPSDLPASPPVTIVSATVTARSDGTQQIEVAYTVSLAATVDNYTGVHVFLEDPDISALSNVPLDGTATLNGTRNLSGKWNPEAETDSTKSPVTVLVDGDTADRVVRIYLLSYGPHTTSKLVRANLASPTPSIAVPVPKAAAVYVSGMEHAWLVTNPQVTVNPSFDDPAGPTYTLTMSYTAPDPSTPLPPGLEPFGGVDIWFGYIDSTGTLAKITQTGIVINVLDAAGFDSAAYPPSQGTTSFLVYFVSRGIDNQANTLIPGTAQISGTTPRVLVTITYPPLGTGIAPSISAFTIDPTIYRPAPDGSVYEEATLRWTLPASTPRYGGVNFYVTQIDGVPQANPQRISAADAHTTQVTLSTNKYPAVAQAWTITAISVGDKNAEADDPANPHSYSPSVVWNVGPPGAPGGAGNDYAPLVDLSSMAATVTDQQLSSDGVQMMRFTFTGWTNPLASDPRVNSFGGVKIAMQDSNGIVYYDAGKATSFKTPWLPAVSAQTLKFFWVSYDPQNKLNQLLPGTTPERDVPFAPNPGSIKPSRTDIWWSPEFDWPAGGSFMAVVFNAQKINVGKTLVVGGAPASFGGANGSPVSDGQIAVKNSGGAVVGWIGTQQPTQGNGAATYGAWFGQLWVGGHDPRDAPLWVNNQGIVILGGIQYQSAGPPFVSIRTETGIEVGKMGAQLNLDSTGAVISGAPAIGGAWFNSFALGGPNLAAWKLLATNDAAYTVKLRDINLFQITWPQNALGHTNNTTQLTFGLDAYLVGLSTTFAFPGITLVDTSAPSQNFGFALINRGLVLYGYQGYRRASLVTFNGDSTGSNSPQNFWAELALYNPADTAGSTPNVYLASGYNSAGTVIGDSQFIMRDRNGTQTFNVTFAGVAIALGGYWTTARQVIDAAGNWVGNPISGGGGVASLNGMTGAVSIASNGSLNVSAAAGTVTVVINPALINTSGAFVSSGGVDTSGGVRCGSLSHTSAGAMINGSGQWVGKEILANGNIQTTGVYAVSGGFFGLDYTVTIGGVTLYFKGGILYNHS